MLFQLRSCLLAIYLVPSVKFPRRALLHSTRGLETQSEVLPHRSNAPQGLGRSAVYFANIASICYFGRCMEPHAIHAPLLSRSEADPRQPE
jgi:hypothetical protein